MHLRFVASESTFDYFRATRSYLERHGKPVAFYSDKHSIFRVDFPPWSGGVRSERHAAVRMVIRSMLARASAGVR